MAKIFISYRREDSRWPAHKLYDTIKPLVADPENDVFIDVDNIPLGVNFAEHLDSQVAQCDFLLAVIGPHWLSITNPGTGQRRLDDPKDFVRIEIAAALKRGIPVIPVMVDGGRLPAPLDLPDNLRELPLRNGIEVRHLSFEHDVERLLGALELRRAPAAPAPAPVTPPARVKFDSARYVFISHPHNVAPELVREVARRLIAAGMPVWIYDPRPFGFEPAELASMSWQKAGGDYFNEAMSAVEGAQCVVMLTGRKTSAGGFQTKELEHALAKGAPVVAVIVEEVPGSADSSEMTVMGSPYDEFLPEGLKGRYAPQILAEHLGTGRGEKSLMMLVQDVLAAADQGVRQQHEARATLQGIEEHNARAQVESERSNRSRQILLAIVALLVVAALALASYYSVREEDPPAPAASWVLPEAEEAVTGSIELIDEDPVSGPSDSQTEATSSWGTPEAGGAVSGTIDVIEEPEAAPGRECRTIRETVKTGDGQISEGGYRMCKMADGSWVRE